MNYPEITATACITMIYLGFVLLGASYFASQFAKATLADQILHKMYTAAKTMTFTIAVLCIASGIGVLIIEQGFH